MSEPLDARTVPLWGSRLIEASAGTGKTWTIAALYLRLVLGHGGPDTAFATPLTPAQILVMTFTRAATRELVERIRARLVEAAAAFRGGAAGGDPLLERLMADHPSAVEREGAAWRVATAADAMDDAAIFTIDAWVQRVLREHAFDSGGFFDEELMPDEDAMLADAARDLWRREVYPLRGAALDAVEHVWPNVDALVADMRDLLPHVATADDDEHATLATLHAAATGPAERELVAAKAAWSTRLGGLRDWLLPRLVDGSNVFKKTELDHDEARRALDALARWVDDPAIVVPDVDPSLARQLTTTGLLAVRKGKALLEVPTAFGVFTDLADLLERAGPPAAAMRRHAARRVKRRIATLKRAAGIHGFLDLQERLDEALHGPSGDALRRRILAQYPVALIDEFQDTSALQYRILDRLYGVANNARETGLFLIGDPKQSIYAFRGADVHNYLRARTATTGRHVALATNHRSTPALVAAVNRLFETGEGHDEGAFRFGGGAGRPLPFVAVGARGRAETLVDGRGPLPPLTLVHDPALESRDATRRRFAAACAEAIVGWLGDAATGFRRADGDFARMRPADVAVLVRDRNEAAFVRHALRERGVASVFLSDSESVFQTAEASDLLPWLQAVAEPRDARLARRAFATSLVGLSLDDLAEIAHDDRVFDERLEQLAALHAEWRDHGVLPMLRRTLHLLDLPTRWRERSDDGERRLTNFLHLAELLQRASATVEGEHALIRWLSDRIASRMRRDDDEVVRLESEADLVQVLTVHMSKGLEFPVVCLPFVTAVRDRDDKASYATIVDADGRRALHLDLDDDLRDRAHGERQQEDARILYVATTRARHALWVGVPAFRAGNSKKCGMHLSAFGYLLGGGREIEARAIADLLTTTFGDLDGVRIEPLAERIATTRLVRADTMPPLRGPQVYAARFERNWSIGSFSSLVRDLARVPRAPIDPAIEEEVLSGPVDEPDARAPAALSAARHRFPRGAYAGNFLHDQLEWLGGHDFALAEPSVQAELVTRCERLGWTYRADDVVTWLGEVVTTTLPPIGASLDRLAHRLPEMEFWFPSTNLATAEVDRICARHLLDGRPRPPLAERALTGMLMGFADLVFEVDGRYWVLDYKSNALGAGDDDYDADAIAQSMIEHRYDVQGAVYLVALHRLLRQRMGSRYDPALHLGGALYLYLRGIATPHAGCHVLPADPALLQELDAALSGRARDAA